MARHQLQRLEAPSRQFSLLLHAAGIASFTASFRFLNNWDTPMSSAYGGHYQFLTIIGLSLAQITFIVGLLADITLSPSLFAVKNALSVFSAPLEILITVLYWGLCAINKDLVFPPDFHLAFLPDFGFHAAPGLLLAVDLLFTEPAMDGFAYWFWVEYCFTRNGWYPYPIFDVLSTWQRFLLFSFSSLVMSGSTMALKWLYGKLNGVEQFQKEAVKNPAGVRTKGE
ncbi:hypothetical protein PG988_009812 [Apiospora saccharicola]